MIKELTDIALRAKKRKYPSLPDHGLSVKSYSDKTANGLTRCIIDFLRFEGWQAERINCTGRLIDNRQVITDVIGRHKRIGSSQWIPTSGQRGTADISAIIQGCSIKIEVKIGRDRQSPAQKEYQRQVEQSGGVYFIARSWMEFVKWFDSL